MSTHSREAVPGCPFPKLSDPSRTVHIGRSCSVYGPICEAFKIGEYHAPNYNIAHHLRTRAGWFVTPAEMEQITAEIARRRKATMARRLEQNRQRDMRVRAARKHRPPRQRALETWRRECADPMSDRDPKQAWAYACAATPGMRVNAPMPTEAPPERVPRSAVVVEAAGRRDGGEYGRTETSVERGARSKRAERRSKRPLSCATSNQGGRG